MMAGARVYIAAHYPQDVLAGLTLGAFIAVAGYWVARRPLTSLVCRLQDTRLRPLVPADPSCRQPTADSRQPAPATG
jgi:membrane-associated phospholipid phosphatase